MQAKGWRRAPRTTVMSAGVVTMVMVMVMAMVMTLPATLDAAVRKKGPGGHGGGSSAPLLPPVEEVAHRGAAWANATCGADGPQRFCRATAAGAAAGSGGAGDEHCDVCDARVPARAHPPAAALLGAGPAAPDIWWQSPSLAEGEEYERVTFTLDLKREYEVVHVTVKAGPAPLPAAWALERSLDGASWRAWRYFAPSDADCWAEFGAPARANALSASPGATDDGDANDDAEGDAPCTVAPPGPSDGGEVHVSVLPGGGWASPTASAAALLQQSRSRFVRLRMVRMRGAALLPAARFYALRAVRVGARCACGGQAARCVTPAGAADGDERLLDNETDGGEDSDPLRALASSPSPAPVCQCRRGSCGASCERCCPLFNQRAWRWGAPCEPCLCHGHAVACRFDAAVAQRRRSMDTRGRLLGGGVCVNCTANTAGVNCETCADGFFRPAGVRPDAPTPCERCSCAGPGATGRCARDEHHAAQHGLPAAGACECRQGFAGARCERCAAGHRAWPRCARCPCDARGALGTGDACDEDGKCRCKANVEGAQCDRCRPGFFGLSAEDPMGCARCICSGVSDSCHSATLPLHEETSLDGWLLTDLTVSRTVVPTNETVGSSDGASTANEKRVVKLTVGAGEIPGAEALFWLAPSSWRGAHLDAYGRNVSFSVTWDVMRGDTSGKPTVGPNVVLIGANGMRLAHGHVAFRRTDANITVPLWAPDDPSASASTSGAGAGNAGAVGASGGGTGWFHLAQHVMDIPARPGRRPDHRGARASRADLLAVLADVRHALLRAHFHTDQVEGSLYRAALSWGSAGIAGLENPRVERCDCPPGYEGLSCERCAFGYVRIPSELSGGEEGGIARAFECRRCNCNGHAATCDPETGACSACEHNTSGAQCGECAAGFWGDASRGLPSDCRRCACPGEDQGRSFSPTCEALPGGTGYRCTACARGHAGDHCERCEPGYFGNPRVPGGSCEACACSGGPCDPETGRCLQCPGNTEGWRCERCLPAHYGDPASADCKPCNCHQIGSLTTENCDAETGQCLCQPQFIGRTCDQCKAGHGNITAGCPPCNCDSIGAASKLCDPLTGQCTCHPGVVGVHCDLCEPLHFGFSSSGCQGCGCHALGSAGTACDIVSGQCACRPGVEGRACDRCRDGLWGLHKRGRCEPCDCDPLGSRSAACDQRTGQCACRPGVGGRRCDACQPWHFGFSDKGCMPCEPCEREGHVCDPDTGRCVCPPLTEGPACDRCRPGAWGLEPRRGCKACDCEPAGASASRCDPATGRCACREAFAGARCELCADGHHGWPRCRRCACHPAGTRPEACDAANASGLFHPHAASAPAHCRCAPDGSCPCKANVEGPQCDRCRAGSFGLSADNPDGCTNCFCFGRSAECTQAGLSWGHLRAPAAPRVAVLAHDATPAPRPPHGALLAAPLPAHVAPNPAAPLRLRGPLPQPLYWPLPPKFLGDRVLSYGGVLSFSRNWEGGSRKASGHHPLVQLKGNGLELEHFSLLPAEGNKQGVRLHESLWVLKGDPPQQVTRELLMLALQKVEHIFIQASPYLDFQSAIIQNISLDTAVEAPGRPASAQGVELCTCPPEYNSTSCQDPSLGFYRWYSGDARQATIVIQLIGEAKPCQCYGRSNVCDIETGHCLNCSRNTGGAHCERCADGFYGDPDRGNCQPCPCPSPHRNFAVSCHVTSHHVKCHCKPGYTGPKCERCAYGYYGFPKKENGTCSPCKCNPYGSVSDECDEETGECNCKVGIVGHDCSYCQDWHVLTENGCQSCNDSCTGVLLTEIEALSSLLEQNTKHIIEGDIPPPWQKLHEISEAANHLRDRFDEWLNMVEKVDNFPVSVIEDMRKRAKHVLSKANKSITQAKRNTERSLIVKHEAQNVLDEIMKLQNDTNDVVQGLKNYGQVGTGEISIADALQEAKDLLAEMTKRNATINSMKIAAMNALGKCEDILEKIEKLLRKQPEIAPLRKDLEMLTSRLDSLLEFLHGTSEVLTKTKSLDSNNKENLKSQKVNIDAIWNIGNNIEALADEVKFFMDNAKSYLENATLNMDRLEENMQSFANVTQHLMEREGILLRINPLYRDQYVLKAQEHADLLYRRAQQYRDLFNSTKRDADFALRASRAYQGIVDALKTAHDSAINASFAGDVAYKIAFPGSDKTSLVQHAKNIEQRSGELLTHGQGELLKIVSIRGDFGDAEMKLNNVQGHIKNISNHNNRIREDLTKLKSGPIQRSAEEAMMRAESALKISQETNATAARVSNEIRNVLRPKLAALNQDEFLSAHNEKLISAQLNIKRIKELLEKLNQRSNEEKKSFDAWNNTISDKLHKLRSKITQTRHTAEGIHISLTSRPNGGCVRSYRLHNLTPSTTNTIILSYAVHTDEQDASLFYLANNATQEFMALEMVERKIRFVWNAGGGVGYVVHPLKLEKAVLEEDKYWYNIKVQRVSNVATLTVRQQILATGSSRSPVSVSNSSTPGFGIVDVRPGDMIWVGGLPPHINAPPELLAPRKGLAGCLHRILLDGRPLGLWNFATETKDSCTACRAGVEEAKDESEYKFSGDGYSVHTVDSFESLEKLQFSITLKFKTFDENAMLFLAVDENKTKFVSLTLENGYLVFHIEYGRRINMLLRTLEKVNTGLWVHCEAVRAFQNGLEKALLSVSVRVEGEDEGQAQNIHGSPSEPPTEDDLPQLNEFFLGGVPPGFEMNSNSLKLPILHYLGCMKDIIVFNAGVNPLMGKFYGVEASCSESYTVVSFHGRGFLQLPPHPLKKKESSFEFVFRSRQRNSFLMLTEGTESGDYYSVCLQDGRIVLWVSVGGTKTVHQSKKEFNDGKFHSVSLTKKNRKLTLRVDDEDQDTVTIRATDYQVRTAGPGKALTLGGLPPNQQRLNNMVASNESLVGTIKDAIFNNQLLFFEQHITFSHADIGRLGPWELDESQVLASVSKVPSIPTKCNKVAHYSVEPEAVKFGDAPESYIRKTLRSGSLQKSFVIEFSFRTYYPSGLLLIVPVQRKKENHYLLVALHNKKLIVELKGRKKGIKIAGSPDLNDGVWHDIMLKRSNRQLSLAINQQPSGQMRLPRRLPVGTEMYLGGLPPNSTLLPLTSWETFKGCVRRLTINKVVEHLIVSDSLTKNVRQCFPLVERGAYFPGDAYAVYDNEFQIRSLQELEFEFRTSELTGILLSVAETSGAPAISIELNNGKVVMRCDSGDGKPVQVEQSYPSNYTLCDNNWHSIHASFLSNGLFLKVDSLPNVTGLSYNGAAVTSRKSSSLFIGGVPDQATGGTLITREYFKGCIRNLMIGRKRKDWTDMSLLENVHLNSCPLSD